MNALYSVFGGSRGLVNLLSNALGTDATLLVASSSSGASSSSRAIKLLPGSTSRGERGSDSKNGLRGRASFFRCAIASSQLESAPRVGIDRLQFCGEIFRIERVSETRLSDGSLVYRLECERS